MSARRSLSAFDAVVIGGSYAGLSATLQLARARRNVLVVDSGLPRNRFAASSHGFLGRDGHPPAAITADARSQLRAYSNVHWFDGMAVAAKGGIGAFVVETDAGLSFTGKRLVLATGMVDELPDLEGLKDRWGSSVFHCPYCHGYELDEGHIGVLACHELSLHQALLLPDWGDVTLFTNEVLVPDAAQQEALAARGVRLERRRLRRILDAATVELDDGSRIELAGLFVASRLHMASDLPQQLGCEFEQGPLGDFVRTGVAKETTVPGVFACGDTARMAGSVALAVGDGALAGSSAHQSLVFHA